MQCLQHGISDVQKREAVGEREAPTLTTTYPIEMGGQTFNSTYEGYITCSRKATSRHERQLKVD
jgi:hypothetical protein